MVGYQGIIKYRPRWGCWKPLLLLLLVVVLVVMAVGRALELRSALAWQREASRRPVAEVLELEVVAVALL